MSPTEFQLPLLMDYVAVVAWTLSGALVGIRKKFDVVGVFLTALVAATGSSFLRDGVLLQRVPPVLTDAVHLPLIAVTATLAMALARKFHAARRLHTAIELIDAIGTPAFTVVGVEYARQAGLPLPGVFMVGCIGGVGGGILRDVLVREVPEIMRPGHYLAILVAAACALYMLLTIALPVPPAPAAWGVVAAYFTVRYLTVRYDWRTRPVLGE